MSACLVATVPRQLPSEIDDTSRNPRRIETMTCSRPSNPKHVDVPLPRLTRPEMIAASCSADARSSELDIVMSSPSDDTATASVTPAVWSTNVLSIQAKFLTSSRTSALLLVVVVVGVEALGPAALDARGEARQEGVHVVRTRALGADIDVVRRRDLPAVGGIDIVDDREPRRQGRCVGSLSPGD